MTRSSDGHATLLVGISNPETADQLVGLAAALARGRSLEVLLAHVVTVADQIALTTGRSSPEVIHARDLLQDVSRTARAAGRDARALVEVARSVEDGLLSAAESHDARMILVGYTGQDLDDSERSDEEARFDRSMHRVARKASADVVVAKFRRAEHARILVPLAEAAPLKLTGLVCKALAGKSGAKPRSGGPRGNRSNRRAGGEDSPVGHGRKNGVKVTFLHVADSDASREEARSALERRLGDAGLSFLGALRVVVSDDAVGTILEEAEEHDIVLLGPSGRPGILDAIFSSRARQVAEGVSASVILAWGTEES